jgi:hypothetical protein
MKRISQFYAETRQPHHQQQVLATVQVVRELVARHPWFENHPKHTGWIARVIDRKERT